MCEDINVHTHTFIYVVRKVCYVYKSVRVLDRVQVPKTRGCPRIDVAAAVVLMMIALCVLCANAFDNRPV